MYDRNGKLLVFNQATYDVMMVSKEMKEFDTIDFCNTVSIEKETSLSWQLDAWFAQKPRLLFIYTSTVYVEVRYAREYAMLQENYTNFRAFTSKIEQNDNTNTLTWG